MLSLLLPTSLSLSVRIFLVVVAALFVLGHAMSCHGMACHVMPCLAVSCHAISVQNVSSSEIFILDLLFCCDRFFVLLSFL